MRYEIRILVAKRYRQRSADLTDYLDLGGIEIVFATLKFLDLA